MTRSTSSCWRPWPQSCVAQTRSLMGRVDDVEAMRRSRRRLHEGRRRLEVSSIRARRGPHHGRHHSIHRGAARRRPPHLASSYGPPCTAPTLCGATKTGLRRCAAVLECNVKSPSLTVSLDSNALVPATSFESSEPAGVTRRHVPNLWCLDAKANVRAAFSGPAPRDRAPPPTGRLDASSKALRRF